jgi:antitoxin HicB
MSTRKFKVILEWDSEGAVFNVSVPALPGCSTYGKTRDEALERSQEAIAGFIEALEISNMPVPQSDVEIAEVVVSYG